MTPELQKIIRDIGASLKPLREEVARVSVTGEWSDGTTSCLLGMAVERCGGSFKLGMSGKYIPADVMSIKLCEELITDHPQGEFLGKQFAVKWQRINEAKGRGGAY